MRAIQDIEAAQGSNRGRAWRLPALAGCVLLASAIILPALLPTTASAEQPRFWTSCENFESVDPAIQCEVPRGIGVDPNTPGHLYIADQANDRIVELTAWGEFVKAWGWGVRDGSEELQTCTTETGCQTGIRGSGAGQLSGPQSVAIDSEGSLYVHESACCSGNYRLQKFDLTGSQPAFEWMRGTGVNQGPSNPGDLCTAAHLAEGDTCGAGAAGTGPGQFTWPTPHSFIAIDHKGTLGAGEDEDDVIYVGDTDRIQEFDVDGAYLGEIALPEAGKVGSLAVDSRPEPQGGNLYFSYPGGEDVLRLDPTTGEVLDTLEIVDPKTSKVQKPTALATDAAGNVYVFAQGIPGGISSDPGIGAILAKFNPSGGFVEAVAQNPSFNVHEEFALSTGIAAGSACLSAGSDVYASNGPFAKSFVRAWGSPPDDEECPPERRAPSVESQYATSVATTEAAIEAQVNPHYWSATQGETTYYVQYATVACVGPEPEAADWEAPCVEEHPAPPGSTLEAGVVNEGVAAPVFLTGLEPGTAYRFRFAAESKDSKGDPTVEGQPVFGVGGTPAEDGAATAFSTFPEPDGPNPECDNQEGASQGLPDCRAYELVSPVDKANGDIAVPLTNQGDYARLDQAATSGNGIAFSSYRAFGDPEGAPYSSQYIARRGSTGWSSEGVSAPQKGTEFAFLLGIDTLYRYFSPDLSEGWHLSVTEPVLAPGGQKEFTNIYRRQNPSGSYEACTTAKPPGADPLAYAPQPQGVSANGSTAAFRANAPLTEDASAAEGIYQTYICSENGGDPRELQLASVLPGGFASDDSSSAGSGGDPFGRTSSLTGALSGDGSRLYWTTGGRIYLRTNPSEPQSVQEFGSAQGKGDTVGPAKAICSHTKFLKSLKSCELKEGQFAVGQAVSGEGLAPETIITDVKLELGELIVDKAAAQSGTFEVAGQPSNLVTSVGVEEGAFVPGQALVGTGIAPGTTIEAVAGSTLTLSSAATQTATDVPLEAFSECTQPERACTLPVSDTGARFWAAAPDGSKVLYSQGGALHRYEAASEESEQVAPGFAGFAGASEDLLRVYFTSSEVLSVEPNSEEDLPIEGRLNLYAREVGGEDFDFIATLTAEDGGANLSPISETPNLRSTRTTPDGEHLAFMSTGQLTGYDNTDRISGRPDAEVYLYDAVAKELLCASCNPSGARPVGQELRARLFAEKGKLRWAAAYLPGWMNSFHATRALSADGERLFFNSFDALALTDTNGKQDVYQWEAPGSGDCSEAKDTFSEPADGCIELISSGKSTTDSEFIDADPSGDNVFFVTSASLVDHDPGLVDIYDARVDGGLPGPPNPQPPCEGEGCQSPPPAPEPPAPPSALPHAGGNLPDPVADCGTRARRAAKQSRRAKALRRTARKAASKRRTGVLRRRSVRFARKARQNSNAAKRCRRARRGAPR